MKLSFNHSERGKKPGIPKIFRKIVREIESIESKKLGEICLIFVSREKILSINRTFLKHDYVTDVISFNNSVKNLIAGDIYICTDVVMENAGRFNVDFEEELMRVMIHGILHLLGYNDASPEEKDNMREREDFYLDRMEGAEW